MFALGRGQRELIIGDRAIGKTAIAVDCIINQKTSDIICVYVAIGQKSSTVKRVINAIQTHGAPERCIFVVASASAPPGLQWIAPFSGFTMAEYFRDRGQHALVVIDDMTKHAATHREIALLTRQPPGREAYPGDVFYVHATAARTRCEAFEGRGGGSLTALPIAELDAGNLSAYIPTNLISITDGQIVLDARLFYEGRSRRSMSGQASVASAAMPRRPHFEGRGDAAARLCPVPGARDVHAVWRHHRCQVKSKITRGQRIRAVFSQPQYAPLRLADEVALVLALQCGLLDSLPLEQIEKFRAELPGWLDRAAAPVVDKIERSGSLDDTETAELKAGLSALATHLVRHCRLPRRGPRNGRRLADIVRQIQSVRQLEAVVTAMRGIAASRAQKGRSLLPGIDAYSKAISRAIGQALTLLSPAMLASLPLGGRDSASSCFVRSRALLAPSANISWMRRQVISTVRFA